MASVKIWSNPCPRAPPQPILSLKDRQSLSEMSAKASQSLRNRMAGMLKITLHSFSYWIIISKSVRKLCMYICPWCTVWTLTPFPSTWNYQCCITAHVLDLKPFWFWAVQAGAFLTAWLAFCSLEAMLTGGISVASLGLNSKSSEIKVGVRSSGSSTKAWKYHSGLYKIPVTAFWLPFLRAELLLPQSTEVFTSL